MRIISSNTASLSDFRSLQSELSECMHKYTYFYWWAKPLYIKFEELN